MSCVRIAPNTFASCGACRSYGARSVAAAVLRSWSWVCMAMPREGSVLGEGPSEHPVRERRQARADLVLVAGVDLRHHNPGPVCAARNDLAPRVDDHRVTVGPTAVR